MKRKKVVRRQRRAAKLEVVATIIIKRPADMTKKGKRQVAAWIKSRGALLIKHADLMAPRFTARYYAKKSK